MDSNNEAVSQDNVRARAAAIIDFAKAAVGVAKCSAAGEATVVQKAAETGETTQEVCLRSQGLRGVTLVNGRQVEFRVKSAACTYSKEVGCLYHPFLEQWTKLTDTTPFPSNQYKNWSYRESLQAFGDENVVNGEYYRYVRVSSVLSILSRSSRFSPLTSPFCHFQDNGSIYLKWGKEIVYQ